MKIYRLLSIINTMLTKDLVTAKHLAEKHEVSVKTIQRDIETLNMAGIPVYSKKGINGGYGILDSYKFDTKLLSSDEVNLLKSMLDSLTNVYSNKSMESLWDKLESAIITIANKDTARVKVDFTPWNKDDKLNEKINQISDAIKESRVLSIEYYNSSGDCLEREIEPYELVLRHGRWYMFAFCLQKRDMRTFKVNRISGMELEDRHFHVRDYKSIQTNDAYMRDEVKKVLRFNKAVYYRLVDMFDDDEIIEVHEDYVIVATYLKQESWLIPTILSFGDDVRVVEPESLKVSVMEKINKMNNIYK